MPVDQRYRSKLDRDFVNIALYKKLGLSNIVSSNGFFYFSYTKENFQKNKQAGFFQFGRGGGGAKISFLPKNSDIYTFIK